MTEVSPVVPNRWSVYNQRRYINMIERITNTNFEWEVQDGKWAGYSEGNLRVTVERLTGKKFVFGFDPTDPSMVESDPTTHGWFLTESEEASAR
jgi:hypothetical protein